MANNTQSRKWQITINNPAEKDISHDVIKEELKKIKPIIYYCICDEIGGKEHTHHTHVFFACSSAVRFSTVKKKFPFAHIELAKGTSSQNRDYIFKSGKWESSQKSETSLPETQKEWGELPIERQGARNDLADLYDMIKSGLTNYEIMESCPDYLLMLDKLERIRQTVNEERFKKEFRHMEVTYVWGMTNTGKTRDVMEHYGYENVFRVTNYLHGGFDNYKGQDVIMFEEFRSNLKIQDMLCYLDGYPIELPCRYVNKVACFTKVFIVSNINLTEQYRNVAFQNPETWDAFIRRIHTVKVYKKDLPPQEYTMQEYQKSVWFFTDASHVENPFVD